MAGNQRAILGSILYWLLLVSASGVAFSAGFYYTFGATANIPTKTPTNDIPNKAAPSPVAVVKATPTPTIAPGIIPAPSPAATTKPVAQATMAPTTDPFAVATAAPTATPKATPKPSPQAEIYRVQVGSFDNRDTAQKQVDELVGIGINAMVVYDNGAYHAQLGAFSDRARAISVADEVNIRGYSVTIRH